MRICLDTVRIANSTVLDLHEGRTPQELAPALFKFVAEILPQEMLFLMLRPLEFELRSFCSRSEFQEACDNYIAKEHQHDIWLQRSPIKPEIAVVRHSLYTPRSILHRSRFYRNVLQTIGCEYGASLVAWRQATWLGNLTIFRTEAQGDFRNNELPILKICHRHFEAAIRRIASFHEQKLTNKSLATFLWNLPTAGIVLDWNLKLLHWNVASQELIAEWKKGSTRAFEKRPRRFSVPNEILAAIEQARQPLARYRPDGPKGTRIVPLGQIQHPQVTELSANVSFLPSTTLTLSKGTFLIALHRRQTVPDDRESYDRLTHLTRRERAVALLAASGKNNAQIGKNLGTSAVTVRTQLHHAYRKLGINSRYQLMAMFARNPLGHLGQAQM